MSSRIQDIVAEVVRHWFPNDKVLIDHRPAWLKGMEMDIYLPDRNLAIEVQGRQHKLYSPIFHDSVADFIALKERDAAKGELIRSRVRLAYVCEWHKTPFSNLAKWLRQFYEGDFKYPQGVWRAWQEHWMLLFYNHVHRNIAFVVKPNRPLMALNIPSKNFILSNQYRTGTLDGYAPMAGNAPAPPVDNHP